GRDRRRTLQGPGVRVVERDHRRRRRPVRVPSRFRVGRGVRLLPGGRVHRDDHHRRPRLGLGRRAGRSVRHAAAACARRDGGGATPLGQRGVLSVPAEVRRLRVVGGGLSALRASGAGRHLAPRAQLVRAVAAALPAAAFGVVTSFFELTPMLELEKLVVVYLYVATAIQGVYLRVLPGSLVMFLWINGAGKT